MAKTRPRSRTERRARESGARAAPPASPWGRLLRRLEVPAAAEPLDLRREWPHPLAVFATLLALYAATAPRTVCLEDDGLFILASRGLGLPQPPGYPLLVLLGKLASLVPLGSLAYRVHLVSAVCGAATCAVLWLVLRLLVRDRLAAHAGALLLGVSAEFWSQAIIAEVYTLNTLFFFGCVYLALSFGAGRRPRTLYLLAGCYGLSLANHWPLMGLSTACLALLLLPRWREVVPRLLPLAALALACAAAPYLLLWVRSHQHPEINFYGPLRSLRELWFFVSRQGFGEVDVSETATGADRVRFLGYLLRECVRQFTPAGAALAAVGCWVQVRRLGLATALALWAGFLGSTLVLGLLLGFDYEPLYRSVIRVYPLVPYGIMAIWLVLGGRFLLERLRALPAPAVQAAAWAALVGLALWVNLGDADRSRDTFARDQARAVLGSLDRDAVLFVHGDMDTFPLAYERLAEGVRPDVTLYSDQGLLFENRLFDFTAPADERQRRLAAFLRATPRPVYFGGSAPDGFSLQDGGLAVRVRADLPPGTMLFDLSPTARAFLDRMEAETSRDAWTVLRRDGLRRRFARVLAYFKVYEPERFAAAGMAAPYDRLAGTAQGLLGVLDLLTTPQAGLDVAALLEYAARAEEALGPMATKEERSFPAYARGRALRQAGRLDEAEASFRASLELYPSHRNRARAELETLRAQRGR